MIGSGCKREVALTHLVPAQVQVSTDVQRLLLVDRTEPESRVLSVVTGLLTGEVPFEVKNAVEATLSALQMELNTSPRFEVIRASERLKGGLFSQTFPSALSWDQVEALAASYNADAVLALELFNSDWIVTEKAKMITQRVGSGKDARDVQVQGVYMEGVANVSAGFRLYDPKSRTITDQHNYSKTNLWSAEAANRTQAAANLINKVAATQFVGRMAGASYAHRIAPMYVVSNRSFFRRSKTSPSLEIGSRQAEVGQWEQAIQTWKGALPAADSKTAARLSYNIAVAYEVMGDLNNAIDWAGRAYANYGLKAGRNYTNDLRNRAFAEESALRQLPPLIDNN